MQNARPMVDLLPTLLYVASGTTGMLQLLRLAGMEHRHTHAGPMQLIDSHIVLQVVVHRVFSILCPLFCMGPVYSLIIIDSSIII